jgi:hypothetical protein
LKVEDILMNQHLILASLVLACACWAQSPATPFACNLKAFTPAERADWRKELNHVMLSVSAIRELADGYSFKIDPHRASFVDLAQWIELERKCCPFFSFELGMHGEDGGIWLNLRGRPGVKEFIAADFQPMFDRLAPHPQDRPIR